MTNEDNKTKLDVIIQLLFMLLVFFFPASIALRNVFLGLTFIFFVINKLVKKEFSLVKTEFNKYIAIFFLFSLVSLIKAANLELGVSHLLSPVIRYIAFYFIALDLIEQDNIKRYLNIMVVSNLVLLSYGLYVDYFTSDAFFYRTNGNGTLVSFIIIFFISLLVTEESKLYRKLILGLGIIGATWALVLTYSRGASLGFMVAILVWISLLAWKKFRNKVGTKRLIIIILILLISSSLLTTILAPDKLVNRFKGLQKIEASKNLRTRVAMWQTSLLMIRDNPLLGIGIGNFRASYLSYLEELNIEQSTVYINHDHPHNLFLYIAAEQGVISLLVLLVIWFKVAQLAINNYLKGEKNYSLGLALLSILAALFVHSLVDTTVRYGHVGFYVILVVVFNLKAMKQRFDFHIT